VPPLLGNEGNNSVATRSLYDSNIPDASRVSIMDNQGILLLMGLVAPDRLVVL
jgi:hypothetical protein